MSGLAVVPVYMTEQSDLDLTLKCLMSLKLTAPDCQVHVVDDFSPERSLVQRLQNFCREQNFTITMKRQNEGFSRTVNVGLKAAVDSGHDAILVNADIEFFEQGWYERMLARDEEVVGALLVYPSGGIQHAGIYYSVITRNFDHIYRMSPMTLEAAQKERICPVTGALQRIKWSTLLALGLYDENFRLAYEDVDYCQRVFLSGGKCVYDPTVRAIHHETVFRGKGNPVHQQWYDESKVYLHRKYAGVGFAEYIPTMITDYFA